MQISRPITSVGRMNATTRIYLIYGALIVATVLVHASSNYGGLWGCVVSAFGIYLSRTIIFLVLSFANVSLSVAFDNFLRVDPYFYFYTGSPGDVNFLSLASLLLFIAIGMMDATRRPLRPNAPLIDFKFPEVSPLLFWPFAILTVGASFFILMNENLVLQSGFDADDLKKYTFLEYISLVIVFMIQSVTRGGKFKLRLAYLIAAFFVLAMVATSYRMVGIISTLAAVAIVFNGRKINKSTLVVIWLATYVALAYISYWRLGVFNINVENILGYKYGRLDNTFTGVIETSMIYIDIGRSQSLVENIKYLIGATLPVPNTFIPDSMLYIVDLHSRYRVPGGGALAGFMMYFNYLYLVPYAIYFWIAFYRSGRGTVADGMYLILFCTVMRWWLYGPYVIFKFLGVLWVFMLLNNFAKRIKSSKQRLAVA
jgi:hypothetical protein